jgi:hypothetical protein
VVFCGAVFITTEGPGATRGAGIRFLVSGTIARHLCGAAAAPRPGVEFAPSGYQAIQVAKGVVADQFCTCFVAYRSIVEAGGLTRVL